MALPYRRSEAKEWARENLNGVWNVLMPTFTSDLRNLNEVAIRHDLNRNVELGFTGTLLVSECGTTMQEMKHFIEIAAEAKPDGFHLCLHGSFDTLEDTIEMAKFAEQNGCDSLLLAYPLMYNPQSSDDVYQFTEAVSQGTDLAIILFAVRQWGFRKLDPRQYPLDALIRMAELDTVSALKYECGHPGTAAMVEVYQKLADRVVISDPMEFNAPAWIAHYGMPWMGTSNYEYLGDRVPRMFRLMHEGRWQEAFELYWSVQPAREAFQAYRATVGASGLVPRLAWKYLGWLNGFNGGPIRMPHLRLNSGQMAALRRGLQDSDLDITSEPDEAFFIGRHPR